MGSLKTSSGVFCLIIASDMSSFVSCLLLQLVMVHFGPSEGRSDDLFRKEVLEETNKLRRNHGLGILKEDAVLEKQAQKWADYLTKSGTCNRPSNHQNPLPFPDGAENIFVFGDYAGTGKIAVDKWYTSEGHRINMMNGRWTRIGVGYAGTCKRQGRRDGIWRDSWITVALYTP